ncbi:NADH-quinone oxidoreductase subunit N [Lapillicoccus jejuensis]|uniref:NADH dehydrogenase subunit N n=1 Tax=Lapillicoccus jejuensis TaxID=402171 RepID=A0A542DXF9_9MICO|nr:NADH dehydrogenase subunit N [Lapillicoccus jejuensis]
MVTSVSSFDAALLLPALAPALGALLVLVVDAVVPRTALVHQVVGLVALVVGAGAAVLTLRQPGGDGRSTLCLPDGGPCFWTTTGVSAALQLGALLSAVVVLLLAAPLDPTGGQEDRTAVTVALLLAATSGAAGVASARDLGSWLVTLELATLPVVALAALPATRRAVAGAVQLLLTSLVSFAVLALAAACWYAATGSPSLTGAAVLGVTGTAQKVVLGLAVVLVVAGVGFKLSLAPFHAWTPTAYAGAPLPVAVFLSATSKVAALGALLVVVTALESLGRAAIVTTAAVALVSMTLGNLVALRQDDAVRLLAWSTVAQAGWVVLPLVSVSSLGARASASYLLTYVVATVAAFAVVAVVVRGTRGRAGRRLTSYTGLVRAHPFLGGVLALALTVLAGVPPGVLGVVAKVVVLEPVVAEGWWPLAVVAALNVVLGVAVYLRWFLRLLQRPEGAPGGAGAPGPVLAEAAPLHRVAVVVSGVLLVALSVQPQLLLGLLG